MSSPSSSTHPCFYRGDKLTIQRDLIQLIAIPYLPALENVFKTPQWARQNEPLDRETMKTFCPKVEKQFVCVFCPNETFTQATKAVEHIQKHFQLYPFDCKRCMQTFRRNNELENHEKTHEPSDGFPCPENCGTTFATDKIGNINRHLRDRCPRRNAGANN